LPTKRRSTSPEGAGFGFPRRERLKKKDEIGRVFKKGRSVTCSGAKLFYIENNLPYNRIVFTFARKYGNAVQRNRARRLGREAYRHLRSGFKTGWDLILLAYAPRSEAEKPGLRPSFEQSLTDRLRQMEILFKKAGLC
jgi:ribonuclease P protein component